MTTKHSPGPWITQHGRIYGPEDFRSRHPNRRILIGGVTTDASGWEAMFGATPRDVMQRDIDAEASANANLMAAAPDLLDVCERILEHYSNHLHPEVKAEIMDAIRSAKGVR